VKRNRFIQVTNPGGRDRLATGRNGAAASRAGVCSGCQVLSTRPWAGNAPPSRRGEPGRPRSGAPRLARRRWLGAQQPLARLASQQPGQLVVGDGQLSPT
jgi:hypothetical protein